MQYSSSVTYLTSFFSGFKANIEVRRYFFPYLYSVFEYLSPGKVFHVKKFVTSIFIILILLPMIIYLNPFTWGMRKVKMYEPSQKTAELMMNLNRKYHTQLEINDGPDTLWYFRDLKLNKIKKLEHFNLISLSEKPENTDTIRMFVDDFKEQFSHRKYFDSIQVYKPFDVMIYKASCQ